MPSLKEVQHQIAIQISMLPPSVQGEILTIVAMTYQAGVEDCKRMYADTQKTLASVTIH